MVRRPSFALNELDRKLAKHIKSRRGFFVEAGANNGLAQSNTLYFERFLDWSGLLIEPIPELARQCAVNRPGCLVEQVALVPLDRKQARVRMAYCNLMSIVEGARGSSEEDEAHLALGRPYLAAGDEVRPVEVAGEALSDVLDRHGIRQIDLLSLDVEGFEPQALDGIDFARHRPRWILVEANDQPEIDSRLADKYDKVDILSHHDVLYRRRD